MLMSWEEREMGTETDRDRESSDIDAEDRAEAVRGSKPNQNSLGSSDVIHFLILSFPIH